ncbi:MAG TPA: type II secretion system protein GspL [Xanthomonadaceae bacterium]|nr:type II secretion system protein GspL [Xanthomonadaceae bacterium]
MSRTLHMYIDAERVLGLPAGARSAISDPGRLREEARRADDIVVMVPGEAVTLLEVPRIARQRSRLLQALPYAVEEQLAQPVEDMHIAAPARVEGERVAVACVAHADMQRWLSKLAELDILPDRMLPDTLALPLEGTAAALVRVGPRVLVRSGKDAGFALEADALGLLSDRLGAMHEAFAVDDEAALLVALAPHLGGASRLDLLDGPYRPRRRASASGPWRLVAALALGALLVAVLYQWLDYRALRQAHAQLQQEAQHLYRQVVPGEGAVPDPVRMLRAESAQRGGAGRDGALALLARVAPLVAGGTTTVRMDALEYRAGSLELSITTPDVPTLDGLRERLDTLPGLRVELTGASPGDAGVQGRIRVQEVSP